MPTIHSILSSAVWISAATTQGSYGSCNFGPMYEQNVTKGMRWHTESEIERKKYLKSVRK